MPARYDAGRAVVVDAVALIVRQLRNPAGRIYLVLIL